MKILVLNGSPRHNGNTAAHVATFTEGTRDRRIMQTRSIIVVISALLLTFTLMGCTATNSDASTPYSDDTSDSAKTEQVSSDSAEGEESTIVESSTNTNASTDEESGSHQIVLTIGDQKLTATLAENSSAAALEELLAQRPLTISMQDYANMEKVGGIGTSLPRNDEQITTEPGDLILYQGNAFVIYYAPNSWNFTRLGKIDGVTADELKSILGSGSVQVTLSQPR